MTGKNWVTVVCQWPESIGLLLSAIVTGKHWVTVVCNCDRKALGYCCPQVTRNISHGCTADFSVVVNVILDNQTLINYNKHPVQYKGLTILFCFRFVYLPIVALISRSTYTTPLHTMWSSMSTVISISETLRLSCTYVILVLISLLLSNVAPLEKLLLITSYIKMVNK